MALTPCDLSLVTNSTCESLTCLRAVRTYISEVPALHLPTKRKESLCVWPSAISQDTMLQRALCSCQNSWESPWKILSFPGSRPAGVRRGIVKFWRTARAARDQTL
eukprot:4267087-Amphidinium_carterae.1